MCCWILQGRLLRKNDFEPVYSQTLFHICTQNPPLPRTKPPPRLIYVVKMFNAKKRPKCSVVRCKAVHCRQHPLVGTQTNICRNQEQISREIKNRFLEKSRTDFWRNPEKISAEIWRKSFCSEESTPCVPHHLCSFHKMSLWNKLFNLNIVSSDGGSLIGFQFGTGETLRHWGIARPDEQGECFQKSECPGCTRTHYTVQTLQNIRIFPKRFSKTLCRCCHLILAEWELEKCPMGICCIYF